MKKASTFYSFVKRLNPKEEDKKKQMKSMKAFFHHPFEHIKSKNLLNNFSSGKKIKKSKIEYLFVDNLYNQDSNESSSNNYNYKVGLNAPLSYNDSSYSNSNIQRGEKEKKNIKKNNNKKRINYYLFNKIQSNNLKNKTEIKEKENKKFDNDNHNNLLNTNYQNNIEHNNQNDIKDNHTPKNLKTNFNINKINKKKVIKHKNNSLSKIYNINVKLNKKSIKNNSEKSIYNKEKCKKINKNKTNNKINASKSNKDHSDKKDNIGIFQKILIDLKHSKSTVNKANKHIIYNIMKSENYIIINNEISKPKIISKTPTMFNYNNKIFFEKENKYKNYSNNISLDFNVIKKKNSYYINKRYSQKQDEVKKVESIKSSSLSNKKIDNIDRNNNKKEKLNKNKEKIENFSHSLSISNKNSQNKINSEGIINNKNDKSNEILQNINKKNFISQINGYRNESKDNIEENKAIPGVKLYKRGLIYKAKKELKTEKLRRKLKEKEDLEIKLKPNINIKSKRITKNNLPIFKRLGDIEKKKQLGLQKIKNLIIKEKEINEETINNRTKKIFNKNNFDNWLLSNDKWSKQKNNKVKNIKEKLNEQNKKNENFNFMPIIDKNSLKLFNKNKLLSKSPVVDRLLNKNKRNEALICEDEKEELLFIPEINKEYQISNHYYYFMEEDQEELYNELKEQVEKNEKKIL